MAAGVALTLAYVFWHQPAAPERRGAYEDRLARFHEALARRRTGRKSACYRVDGAPWVPGAAAYEDWYEVAGWEDVGRLAEIAVSGDVRAPHDEAADRAAWGRAGVYARRAGDGFAGAHATWADKPPGMGYERAFAVTGERAGEASLWVRQIALGPAPELCLLSESPVSIGWEATRMDRVLVCSA